MLRALALVATLGLLAVGYVVVTTVRDSSFEAYAAQEQRALVYVWQLGMINDSMGPGDQGRFTVEFDSSWSRVVDARVEG